MKEFEYIVKADSEKRIDIFLNEKMEEVSRSFIQKIIKEGCVKVNNKLVKANYKVKNLDQVKVEFPELTVPEIMAEEIKLDILYEDEEIIVINKPKQMVVHPAAGHYDGTLVNALMYHCKESLSGINGVMRPGIVHRIDMDTTGSIIVCKTDNAHQKVAEQLKEHSITRKYHAIVHGVVKDDEGVINAPIGRHPIHRKKMSINQKNGKPAITHFRVLERFANHTYVECELETGRTHQIRVHMSSINHPILGDEVYSRGKTGFKLQGQTLHAKVLGCIHPKTNEYIEFEAPLPEYFKKLLKNL